MSTSRFSAGIRTLKVIGWIIVSLVLIYTVSGFWVAPYLIKRNLPAILEEQFGREGSIEDVSINPVLFEVTLKGFSILDKKGGRFVGFEELFFNFEVSSLFKRAAFFDEIRLRGLFAAIERFEEGAFNFSDLLVPSEEKEPEPTEAPSLFPLWVRKLAIQEGTVVFDDRSRKSDFHSQITPINLSISDLHTYLDSGSQVQLKANFESGGSLDWKGTFDIAKLTSTGRIMLSDFRPILIWRYIQDTIRFELRDGVFDLETEYIVRPGNDQFQVETSAGKYVLKNLKIGRKDEKDTLIDIPHTILDGITFDLLRQKLAIASFSSAQGKVHAWVRPDKEMNFADLFIPVNDNPAAVASSPASAAPPDSTNTWLVTVRKIALNDYRFLFEDRSLAKTVTLDFKPLDITLENFSSDRAGTLPFSIKSAINRVGHLNATGGLGLAPLSTAAKLDLKLNLPDFQPYVDPVTKLEFGKGEATVKGDVEFKQVEGSNPKLKFKGMARIDDFVGQDKLENQTLFNWTALKFDNVDFNLEPLTVSVKEVIADRAFTRFIINADGTTNFSKVFGDDQNQAKSGKKITEEGNGDTKEALVQIDSVTVSNASAQFADHSLKPNFSTEMESLSGVIRGLSTDKKSRARIDLRGKADRTAPVRITGQIQFFNPELYTDIALDFKNLSLSNLTPYSGKFAGYKIKKGKMAVDLRYTIQQNRLTAENNVVIKQLALGEKIESPDAVSLPLSLAIALLQDANGVINLDLPLRGSLDDPQFSIWGIIGDVIVNLITKVVTSPFAALGSLIDGDEDLDSVAFDPGRSEITDAEKEKLDKVVEALHQRPALNIEITGFATEADAEQQFRNAILSAKNAALDRQIPIGEKDPRTEQAAPTLTDKELRRYLLQAYYKQVAGMKYLTLDAPMIEQHLNSAEVLATARRKVYEAKLADDQALRNLAQKRSRNIRDYLISRGLNPERIYLLEVSLEFQKLSESDFDAPVLSELSLTAD